MIDHAFELVAPGGVPQCLRCGMLVGDREVACLNITAPIRAPHGPDWKLDWDWYQKFDWIRALEACPQDPGHHGEGNVWIHTRMVCEALIAQEEWRALPAFERHVVFLAALLHDVSKPETTRTEADGHIGAPHHSPKGAIYARRILWAMGVPLGLRESVTTLIRNHQQPFYFHEKENAARHLVRMSLSTNIKHLYMLSKADNEGRVSASRATTAYNLEFFRAMAEELNVFGKPYDFANMYTQFRFVRDSKVHFTADLHDSLKFDVTMMSGLPGVGKDTWIAKNRPGVQMLSLDKIRTEIGASADGDQSRVIRLARDMAKEYLRAGRPFVYNATNVIKRHRDDWVDLFDSYGARVEIIYLDVDPERQAAQNANRKAVVPAAAIDHIVKNWEVPDNTEAQYVRRFDNGKEIDSVPI